MYILDENNMAVDLNLIPEQVDMNFWVFDNTPGNKDYFCVPLIMVESFYAPTIKLKLTLDSGRKNMKTYFLNVPADYNILIGEPDYGSLEINPVTSLSGRHFKAFCLNPASGFRSEYYHIDVEDVLPTIRWYVPKMKTGQLLGVPIQYGYKPPCVYLVRDIPKSMEIISLKEAC